MQFSDPAWPDAPEVRAAILCAAERLHGPEVAAAVARYPVSVASELPFTSVIYGGHIVLRADSKSARQSGWRHEAWHVVLHKVLGDWFQSGKCARDPVFKAGEARLNEAFVECRRAPD